MYVTGINPTQVWTSAEYLAGNVPWKPGQLATDHQGRIYMFARTDGAGATGAGYVSCFKASATNADMVETTVSAAGAYQGHKVGVAMAAIAASGCGWFCVNGIAVNVQVAASCAQGTRLNTTATAGQLDDDATAGSEEICGIGLDFARGAGGAGVVTASITWPYIGKTL